MNANDRLAAIVVNKRSSVLSIWRRLDLIHTRQLQLNSQSDRSIASLTQFFMDSLDRFEFTAVALELPANSNTRKGILIDHIRRLCRQHLLSLVEVEHDTMRKESWAVNFKDRAQLRSSALSLWPILIDSRLRQLTCDSTLLGLFAQSKRLIQAHLNNN